MKVDESGAPWPYEDIEPAEQGSDPSWECPEGICTCEPEDEKREAWQFSVRLCDEDGMPMPFARCRVIVQGRLANRADPHANAAGWVTAVCPHEPKVALIEWAPKDMPVREPYPYQRRYYVDLRRGDLRERVRRRLSNLGFVSRSQLRMNGVDLQVGAGSDTPSGRLEDVDALLDAYHDRAKPLRAPAATDGDSGPDARARRDDPTPGEADDRGHRKTSVGTVRPDYDPRAQSPSGARIFVAALKADLERSHAMWYAQVIPCLRNATRRRGVTATSITYFLIHAVVETTWGTTCREVGNWWNLQLDDDNLDNLGFAPADWPPRQWHLVKEDSPTAPKTPFVPMPYFSTNLEAVEFHLEVFKREKRFTWGRLRSGSDSPAVLWAFFLDAAQTWSTTDTVTYRAALETHKKNKDVETDYERIVSEEWYPWGKQTIARAAVLLEVLENLNGDTIRSNYVIEQLTTWGQHGRAPTRPIDELRAERDRLQASISDQKQIAKALETELRNSMAADRADK